MGHFQKAFKNSLSLLGGQVVSKFLMVFYVGALARYLSAEGMGQIGTASALCAILFVGVDLGLDTVIVRDIARDRRRSGAYLLGAALIKLAMSLIALAALCGITALGPYSRKTVVIIFIYYVNSLLASLARLFRSLFQAFERMEYDAALQVMRDVLNIGFSLLAIRLGASIFLLVWISAMATAAQLVLSLLVAGKGLCLASFGKARTDLSQIKSLLRICLPFTLLSFATTAYSQLSGILLPVLGSEKDMGYYSAALYIFTTVLLLPGTFSASIFPVFSRMDRSSVELKRAYEKSFRLLTIVGGFMAIQTIVFARLAIRVVYGNAFQSSVPVLGILALIFLMSGNLASGPLLNAAGKQTLFFNSYLVFIALQLVLNTFLIPKQGATGAAAAYLLASLSGFLFYSIYCHRFVRLKIDVNRYSRFFLGAISLLGLLEYLLYANVNVFIVSAIGSAVYLLVLRLASVLSTEEYARLGQFLRSAFARITPASIGHCRP